MFFIDFLLFVFILLISSESFFDHPFYNYFIRDLTHFLHLIHTPYYTHRFSTFFFLSLQQINHIFTDTFLLSHYFIINIENKGI